MNINKDYIILITTIVGIFGLITVSGFDFTKEYLNFNNKITKLKKDQIYFDDCTYKKILKIKIEQEYYNKFYDIITKESKLDEDPYNRKPSFKIIKIFCKLAKYYKFSLNQKISSEQFDFLYKELIKFQIDTFRKKKSNFHK